MRFTRSPIPLEERFWSMVEKTDGCWLWRGATDKDGYGFFMSFYRERGESRVHRIAWMLVHGPIPEGMDVLHKCDNPPCLNSVDHLFLGTQTDNMRDMRAKGRALVGERNPHSKLTEDVVREIRRLRAEGVMRQKVADLLGVSLAVVKQVSARRIWKHVT